MSLFEKLNNKRYDLQEKSGDFSDKQQSDTAKMLNKLFGSKDKSRKTADKAIRQSPAMNPTADDKSIQKSIARNVAKVAKGEGKRQKKIIKKNVEQGSELLKKIQSPADQPSSQLKGETKETLFRKGQTANTGDTNKFRRNATKQIRTIVTRPTDKVNSSGERTIASMNPSEKARRGIGGGSTSGGSTEGAAGAGGRTSPKITGNVDTKKALQYTKKINQKNPNRPEYVKKDVYKGAEEITKKINPKQSRPLGQLVKKTKPSKTSVSGKLTPGQIDFSKSAELASKRKARIDPKTGKATQAGVKDFAMNRGGFGRMSGNMSKSDFKKMVTGDPKKAASFKKIVTDAERIVKNPKGDEYKKIADKINTSDYAGKEARKRPAGSKTFAQVKREIDAKEKAYQTKTLPKQKKLAKTNLINPQRRAAAIKKVGSQNVAFKQTATKAASYLPGGKSKVAKKAIQIASKLGPAGRIAAATGLVLLNPGVRKLARNIGKGAVSSLTGGASKTPVKQTTGRLGINLSPGSSSSSPSKFALKRQELLKKSPNKVPNKNLA